MRFSREQVNVRFSVDNVASSAFAAFAITPSLLLPALLFPGPILACFCLPHAFILVLLASLANCAWQKLDQRCWRVARES